MVPHDLRLWCDKGLTEVLPEFVVVAERKLVPTDPSAHTVSELYFIALCTAKGKECFGKRIRSGEWYLAREDTMAYLYYSLKSARTAADSAIARHILKTGQGWRIAIYGTKPRRRDCRWFRAYMSTEVWPNPTDPVAALAAIR